MPCSNESVDFVSIERKGNTLECRFGNLETAVSFGEAVDWTNLWLTYGDRLARLIADGFTRALIEPPDGDRCYTEQAAIAFGYNALRDHLMQQVEQALGNLAQSGLGAKPVG